MNRKSGVALASLLAITALAPTVQAQTAAAAPPAPPASGPPITGVCILSQEGIIGSSTVGKFVINRLNQLKQAAQSELSAAQSSLQTDARAFEAQRASLTSDQLQQRGAALQGRETDLERTAELRQQEMVQTQNKAFNRIMVEADPIIRQAYQQHNCSLLLNGQAVIFTAPAMDLTPVVVAGLNAKISQFAFEREHLDQGAAGAPGQ